MAACIKMPLGMEVGLGPGDFLLNRDLAPSTKRGLLAPKKFFGPCLLWPNGWMEGSGGEEDFRAFPQFQIYH